MDFREVGPLRRPKSWSFTTRGTDPSRRVGTDREQLLLAVELVPEAPQLTAWGSDADVQSAAIGEPYGLSVALALRIWTSVSIGAKIPSLAGTIPRIVPRF